MGAKKLLIIIGVVSLLFVLALVKNIAQKKQLLLEERNKVEEFILIKDLPETFVSKIKIYKENDEDRKVILTKSPEGIWSVESNFGIKAKKETIEILLKNLKELKGQLRADSKDLFSDFQIEDDKAVHIVLESDSGGLLSHILVSFLKPEWDKNFVRLLDSEKIVLVNKDILSSLNLYNKDSNLDSNYFSDLRLFSFNLSDIQKVRIEMNSKTITLKKDHAEAGSSVWRFDPKPPKAEEVDSNRVDEFLRNLLNIYAQKVMDPEGKDYDLEKPSLRIILKDAQDKELAQLVLGSYLEQDKSYYVKALPLNFIFKVSDFYINNLKKDRFHFLKPKETKNKTF
ncbi:MAG: DUF4340 domain-containing protein [Candidatus Omnitrophica bacterium]|nr:DUF4340 domain-containing protein [Candidatus Omnitrophota bacterium]